MLLLVAISYADRRGWLLARPDDGHRYHLREARVTRVIDGDTIEVDLPDERFGTPTTRVRLWGVDCPEIGPAPGGGASRSAIDRRAEPLAREAKALTQSLVEGRRVRLRVEPHRTRGRFDRLIAHVDVIEHAPGPGSTPPGEESPQISLAAVLLRAGLARRDPRWLHAMMAYYEQLEYAARRRGVGLWSIDRNQSN